MPLCQVIGRINMCIDLLKLSLPRCKNLTRFCLVVNYCFAVCFCFLYFILPVSFAGSFTVEKPLLF